MQSLADDADRLDHHRRIGRLCEVAALVGCGRLGDFLGDVESRRSPRRRRSSRSWSAASPVWSRCGASARLMKNCDVALSIATASRAIAIVPRTFFKPLWASLRMGVRAGLGLTVGRVAAGDDHFAGAT